MPSKALEAKNEVTALRRQLAEAKLTVRIYGGACREMGRTVRTEWRLRQEAEKRAEHAEALAQLMTVEVAALLERLATHVPYTLHTGTGIATQARALAAKIMGVLDE